MIKDFNYSRKSCNEVNLKLKLNTVFSNFRVYLIKEGISVIQDLNKLVRGGGSTRLKGL